MDMQNNRFINYLKLFFLSLHPNAIIIIQTGVVHLWPAYPNWDKAAF